MSLIETIIDTIVDEFTSRERREFAYLTHDAAQLIKKDLKKSEINTGSYAEGFLNHADRDKMVNVDNFLVVDCVEDITDDMVDENIGILIIDSQDCKPGYVRLLVHRELLRPILEGCYCLYNGKKYFNGKKFIENMFSYNIFSQEINKTRLEKIQQVMHGPAIIFRNFGDFIYCFPCKKNLKSTEQFQQQLPCHISKENNLFYFVIKSHQYSQNLDIEFRWSFSATEYNLVRQLTDKEFQLHFLCKELYNTYIKSNDDENCISSYTVKTIILYLLERHKEKIKSKSIINLVKLFLRELKCRLQEKYLPHYFIRECNLFDVLEDDEAQEVIRSIENIEKDLISAILNCSWFMKHQNLVTLYSVYQIVSKLGDFNMLEDILRNILKERSFHKISSDITIKDFYDDYTYQARTATFVRTTPLTNYFDVLCIYFHCHSIFEGKYSCSTITKFKDLLTRFLPLYLVGLASKKHKRSIIHLLIETLLLRSIYLPNPVPTIIYNSKIPLAFYYYLCNEVEKVTIVLTDSDDNWIDIDINRIEIMPVSGGYNFPSIVSNDFILKELFESERPGTILSFSTRFMFLYMCFGMTMNISYIYLIEKCHYAEPQVKFDRLADIELKTIDILKKYIISSIN